MGSQQSPPSRFQQQQRRQQQQQPAPAKPLFHSRLSKRPSRRRLLHHRSQSSSIRLVCGRRLVPLFLVCSTCVVLLLPWFVPVVSRQLTSVVDSSQQPPPPPPSRMDHGRSSYNNNNIVILNMGLPRTGSMALYRFLDCHGICSFHYCCNAINDQDDPPRRTGFPCHDMATSTTDNHPKHKNTQPHTCGECVHQNLMRQLQQDNTPHETLPYSHALDGCGLCSSTRKHKNIVAYLQFDVESSDPPMSWFLPQHFALPLLAFNQSSNYAATRQIWLLPRRDNATLWAQSVLHWRSLTQRLFHAFDLPYYNCHDHNSSSSTTTTHRNKEEVSIGLTEPLSQAQAFQALSQSIVRETATHDWDHRLSLLSTAVYQTHLDRVRSFVQQYNSNAATNPIHLVEVNVDDPKAGQVLSRALSKFLFWDDPGNLAPSWKASCWNLNAMVELDGDWKNFSLPF